MEPIGLTTGLLDLAGLLNNAIDWFEYIQLAQNFGITFQSSLLKLDIERLRLSRWGKAMGINGDVDHTQSLEGTSISEHEMKKAEQLLGMVIKLLEDAKEVSEKFVRDLRPSEEALQVGDAQAELEPIAFSLHNKMRSLCLRRQSCTGLQPQQHLCEAEVNELGTDEKALAMLRDAAVKHDTELEAAIEKSIQNRIKNATSNTWISYGKVGQQVGQQWVSGGLQFN